MLTLLHTQKNLQFPRNTMLIKNKPNLLLLIVDALARVAPTIDKKTITFVLCACSFCLLKLYYLILLIGQDPSLLNCSKFAMTLNFNRMLSLPNNLKLFSLVSRCFWGSFRVFLIESTKKISF
jgi:hypothetical protein